MNTPKLGEVPSMHGLSIQQECEMWKAKCRDLELTVELLKCKNAKLELDVQSLRSELDQLRGGSSKKESSQDPIELRKIEGSFEKSRAPSNVSFGARFSGRNSKDSESNSHNNSLTASHGWNAVVYNNEKLASGEKTAPSSGTTPNVFEEWRIKSVNAITTPKVAASQRFATSLGQMSDSKLMKFPPVSPIVDQVKPPSDGESDGEVTPKMNFEINIPSNGQPKTIKENAREEEEDFGVNTSLFSIPPNFNKDEIVMDSSQFPSQIPSQFPSQFPSQCPSNSQSPQSLYMPRQHGGAKKKSTIAMLEEEKKRKRESVLDPKFNTTYYPGGLTALPEDALNNLSKSIVFPKHTLKRIAEENCDLNATLHLVHENFGEGQKVLDNTTMTDFMGDDTQILAADSAVYLPKLLPAFPPKASTQPATVDKRVPKRSTQLFEEFLVVGADLKEIEGEAKGDEVLKPTVLWQYGKSSDE